MRQSQRILARTSLIVIACLCLYLLPRTTTYGSTPTVTVTANLSQPLAVDWLAVGASHLYNGIGSPNVNATAQTAAESLLQQGVFYNNRQIFGWGMPDPEPSLGSYSWGNLDTAVAQLLSAGGTPVLTLCCAPGWMTAGGSDVNNGSSMLQPNYNPPTTAHWPDYANLAVAIAQRYPHVTHFQVWNELKGFNWDMSTATGYTGFYNTVYHALKAYNPQIQVGGPYINVMGGDLPGVSGPDNAPMPSWEQSDLDQWLQQKAGADFLSFDYSVIDINAPLPSPMTQSFLDNTMTETVRFATILQQIKSDPNYTGLPIWASEDYCDNNEQRLGYMSDAYQAACLSSILYYEAVHGASVSFRWGAEGNASYPPGGNPDQESLYTDPSQSTGGRPYPNYDAYKLFHDYFPPGTQLYATTSDSSMVLAMASSSHVLLINQTDAQQVVAVNGSAVTLAAYQVTVVANSSSVPATPTATPTVAPQGQNLLNNGTFASGGGWWASWWPVVLQNGATDTFLRDNSTAVNGSTYSAKITPAYNSSVYAVQLQQPGLSLVSGHTYTLTYWAKAAASRTLQVCVQSGTAPYTVYNCQTVNLGTGWQEYTMTASLTKADPNAAIEFNVAGSTTPVWFDNVSLS